MNRREYARGIKDARKAIYKGKIGDAALGVLRALVAANDPEELSERPAPRQLRAGSETRIKRVQGKVVRRK